MGSVVVSLDAELAWGFHDLDEPPTERIQNARTAWKRLLELFDTYDVPATWAIVGHLMLEVCDGRHDEHPASVDGWFDRDPGGDESHSKRWFGNGLLKAVENAAIDHEIASHSFSHAVFDPETLEREVAVAELDQSVDAAAERGIDLESFVFPRNVVGYRELLAEHGFAAYRGTRPAEWYDDAPSYAVGKVVASLKWSTPPIVYPEVDEHGLVDVPASFYLFSLGNVDWPFVKPVCNDLLASRGKRGIDEVVDSGGVFHLWLHPNNLIQLSDFALLEDILAYVDTRREQTDLLVETMADVAKRVMPEPESTDRTHGQSRRVSQTRPHASHSM